MALITRPILMQLPFKAVRIIANRTAQWVWSVPVFLLSRSIERLLYKHSPWVPSDSTYGFLFYFIINTKLIDHRKLRAYRRCARYIYINSIASHEGPRSHYSGMLFLQHWVHFPFLICHITSFERTFEFVVHGFFFFFLFFSLNGIKQLVKGLLKLI